MFKRCDIKLLIKQMSAEESETQLVMKNIKRFLLSLWRKSLTKNMLVPEPEKMKEHTQKASSNWKLYNG